MHTTDIVKIKRSLLQPLVIVPGNRIHQNYEYINISTLYMTNKIVKRAFLLAVNRIIQTSPELISRDLVDFVRLS